MESRRPGPFVRFHERQRSTPATRFAYPALLKPAESTAGEGIQRVNSAADLSEALRHFDSPPMIQEVVQGDDLELTSLCLHGTPIAGSTYLSLRNAPLPFGPPVGCRTIRDDQLMDAGIRLLRDLRYHGVAHLDFRRDRRDGQPKLLDFNARLAGTDEISSFSGVNFSHLLYRIALGEEPEPCFDFEPGLEFRWLIFGELRHLMQTDWRRSGSCSDGKTFRRTSGLVTRCHTSPTCSA